MRSFGWGSAIAGALTLLSACAEPPPTVPASDASIERIARSEAHLRSFLLRYAYGSNSVLSDVYSLGREAGCDAISDAVETAVARHLPRWRRDLIASYREKVPPVELAIAAQKGSAAAEQMLEPYDDDIWRAMGRRNGDLIPTANQEVIKAVSATARRDSRGLTPSERELRELKYETIGFELCPDLQDIIRLEDE